MTPGTLPDAHIPVDRRHCLLACGAALWMPAAAAAGRVIDEVWMDPRRSRDVPVRLRLPDAPNWPLVVYSHGLGGGRDGGAVWSEAWVASGMAVLHVQHPGSDQALWRQGPAAVRAAASVEQLVARVDDVRFVLTQALRRAQAGQAPWHALRPEAIGMAGHSFGAHTTQALAGQRYPVAVQWSDPRLRAFLAMSPSSGRGAMAVAEAFREIRRPFFAVTGSHDGDPFGSYAGGEPRAAVYHGLPAGQRALLWLDGADHMTFGGNREPASPLPRLASAAQHEAAHHAIVARLTGLWWRARLLDDGAAWGAWQQRPGIVAPNRLDFD